MSEITIICPRCDARVQIVPGQPKAVCPYCDCVIYDSTEKKEGEKASESSSTKEDSPKKAEEHKSDLKCPYCGSTSIDKNFYCNDCGRLLPTHFGFTAGTTGGEFRRSPVVPPLVKSSVQSKPKTTSTPVAPNAGKAGPTKQKLSVGDHIILFLLGFIALFLLIVMISKIAYPDNNANSNSTNETEISEDENNEVTAAIEEQEAKPQSTDDLQGEKAKTDSSASGVVTDSDEKPASESEQATETEKVDASSQPQESTAEDPEKPKEPTRSNKDEVKEYLGEDLTNRVYDILAKDIGFTTIFFERKEMSDNYVFTCDNSEEVIVTAFVDEEGEFIRIFSPHKVTYYEDGKVLITVEQLIENALSPADMATYFVMAQEIVRSNLKNPSTARFAGLYSGKVGMEKEDGIVSVSGTVTAANDFGAMIDSQYLVKFKPTNEDLFEYQVISCTIR